MKKPRVLKIYSVFIVMVLALGALASPAAADSDKTVLFVIDNVSWFDLMEADHPFLNEFIDESSLGLLNNRTAGRPSRIRNYLTVGAGARTAGSSGSSAAFNATEPLEEDIEAADVFRRHTGVTPSPESVVEVGIARLLEDNSVLYHEVVIGSLADTLESAGKSSAVLGNSDLGMSYAASVLNREVVGAAINSSGLVPRGNVGKDIVQEDPDAPFGVRTDADYLLHEFERLLPEADFIVIDFGDTVRADLYSGEVFPDRAAFHRNQAIGRAGDFLENALQLVDENSTTVIVAALSPPGTRKRPLPSRLEQLTPIMIRGPKHDGGLNLTSPTTRRDGIVSNADIGPTILDGMGLKAPYHMLGRPIVTVDKELTGSDLALFNESAVNVKLARSLTVGSFIVLQLVTFIAAVVIMVIYAKPPQFWLTLLKGFLVTILGLPLVSFFVSKFLASYANPWALTAAIFLASFIFGFIMVSVVRNALLPLLTIAGLTLTVLSVDVFFGGNLNLNTVFGYCPIVGGRFYGVGNEAMAIMISSALLLVGIMIDRHKGKYMYVFSGLIFAVTLTVIGFPMLGANTGGTITAVSAFAAVGLQLGKQKISIKHAALVIISVIVALAGFVGADLVLGPSTHMGRSVNLIADGGLDQAGLIVMRKISENIAILRYSSWSYFMLAVFAVATFLRFRPVGFFHRLNVQYRGLSAAVTGSIVGGVVGFATNDSGIAIPAVIFSYFLPVVVYVMVSELTDANKLFGEERAQDCGELGV